MKRPLFVLFAVFALSLAAFAAGHTKEHKVTTHRSAGGGPDVAYLQKIWDGWSTMKTANVAGFYNQAPDHTFFDVAPVKYNNWQEYEAGVQAYFKDLKSLKLTVNDDAKIHTMENTAWCSATLKEESTTNAGKYAMATFRWTAIFERDASGKWLIVHEHVSAPEQ